MLRLFATAAAFAALATSSALACMGPPMPPQAARAAPSVPYKVFYGATEKMHEICQQPQGAWSCVYPTKDGWAIVIDAGLSHDEQVCSIIYEKAHLPPNNWGDPSVETVATMKTYALSYY